MKRGDVVLVRFPHPSGLRGKKRPAVIVQADSYASAVSTLIVAEVTSNLTMAGDPACLFIDSNTSDGRATGVVRDCVVSCLVLVTVYCDTIVQTLGSLSPAMHIKTRHLPESRDGAALTSPIPGRPTAAAGGDSSLSSALPLTA